MSRRRIVVVAALVLVALVLLFPPFMAIDPAAAGTRHSALGHHPCWRPPAPEAAERVLLAIHGPAPGGRAAPLRIGVNRVRLVMEIGATAVGATLILAIERLLSARKR